MKRIIFGVRQLDAALDFWISAVYGRSAPIQTSKAASDRRTPKIQNELALHQGMWRRSQTSVNESVMIKRKRATREVSVRPIRYVVSASLDGFIAGPNGEVDWLVPDPDFDFHALFNQFDTALLGRRTYEITRSPDAPPWPPGMSVYVFSRTLRPRDHPEVTVTDRLEETLADLRAKSGKDIWLFGGGSLFRSALEARLVDAVEVKFRPVLLGRGIPLFPPSAKQTNLKLAAHHVSRTGIVELRYAVQ